MVEQITWNINVTAIRTNGSPVTQQFMLRFGDEAVVEATIDAITSTLTHWTNDTRLGGVVRFFVNLTDRRFNNSETLEFSDVAGVRLYLEEYNDSKVVIESTGVMAVWTVVEATKPPVRLTSDIKSPHGFKVTEPLIVLCDVCGYDIEGDDPAFACNC